MKTRIYLRPDVPNKPGCLPWACAYGSDPVLNFDRKEAAERYARVRGTTGTWQQAAKIYTAQMAVNSSLN